MRKTEKLLHLLKSFDRDSFLATDEDYKIIDIEKDPYLDRILADGEYFLPKDGFICDKPFGLCHSSVCEILDEEKDEDDILYTGFAKNPMNNEWFTHSFIVNKGIIVESTSMLFDGYFGIPLVGDERKEFILRWKY